ncbi:hypothetical protein SDC9_33839 [bioreactor metagenome]|uniref:Uncharacterized protein n=1 Tax=bioreactor metagenome TaxID=1076179 RepID=A0A644V905_9ZZZZ
MDSYLRKTTYEVWKLDNDLVGAKHQGCQGRSDRDPIQIRNRGKSAGFIL